MIEIEKGAVLIYRVFDVAAEINLQEVERILSQVSVQSRLKIAGKLRHAVIVRNAPVRLSFGEVRLQVAGEWHRCDVSATVWDYGVISVAFQLPLANPTTSEQLLQLASYLTHEWTENEEIDKQALLKTQELTRLISVALKKPNEWHVFEDYTIYFLEKVKGVTRASELIHQMDFAALLLGESKEKLSDRAREGVWNQHYQYAENDLVVIDWNSAFVLEPSGQRDIADVLEFTLTHLLEVRYYDDLIDKRLDELYESIESRRGRIWESQFASLSQEANTRFIEFSEFIERVDNSLKVVGDFYLATLFRGAVKRFRIQDWQQSISRKMNLLARVSELLQGETNVRRGHFLELIIVLLILFEIISAMIGVMH